MEASNAEVILFFIGTVLVARYLDWSPEPDDQEIYDYYYKDDVDGCK